MKKPKFEDGEQVRIRAHADFKYNNQRGGTSGDVFDIYESDKTNEFVYEVNFERGYTLVHEHDLEKAET